jgi:hypothetical protein
VVRAEAGATAVFALGAGESARELRWGERTLTFATGSSLTRVDRRTLMATKLRGTGVENTFAASAEGDLVVVAEDPSAAAPTRVLVHENGVEITRVSSPKVGYLRVDGAERLAVWVERDDDWTLGRDRGFLHTVDAATRVHLRFPMKGSGCANAPEYLVRFEGGKIVTDASCSMGCPSVRWTSRAVTYDARTGAVLSDTSTEEQQSYNEVQAEEHAGIEEVASSLHVEARAVTPLPGGAEALAETPAGVVRVPVRLTPPGISLEASAGASLDGLTISEDGALVAGVVGGRVRVWELATGHALLR